MLKMSVPITGSWNLLGLSQSCLMNGVMMNDAETGRAGPCRKNLEMILNWSRLVLRS